MYRGLILIALVIGLLNHVDITPDGFVAKPLLVAPACAAEPVATDEAVESGESHNWPLELFLYMLVNRPGEEADEADGPLFSREVFDLWQALEGGEAWRIDQARIALPNGELLVNNGWAVRPAGVDFDHWVLTGEVMVRLDGLPANDAENLNVFDVINPGQPVEQPADVAFLCGGDSFSLGEGGPLQRPAIQGWGDVPEDARRLLTEEYMMNLHRLGWLDAYDANYEPWRELPGTFWPRCGYPCAPAEDKLQLFWHATDGEDWEYTVDGGELSLIRVTYTYTDYIQAPRSRPFIQCPTMVDKTNYRLVGYEQWHDYHAGDRADWDADPSTWTIRKVYELTVDTVTPDLYFTLPLFWYCRGVTDGEGNELDWDDELPTPSLAKDLIVHGDFQPGRIYRLEIIQEAGTADDIAEQGPDFYDFSIQFAMDVLRDTPPVTIGVRLDAEGVDWLAAAGAEVVEEDGWHVASWPAGASRHSVMAYRWDLTELEHDGVRVRCIAPPEYTDTQLLADRLDLLAGWLAVRRDVAGPWTVDEVEDYVVLAGPGIRRTSARDPHLLELQLEEDTNLAGLIRVLGRSSLDELALKQADTPTWWDDALMDLLEYRAEDRFRDLLEPGRAGETRDGNYRALFVRGYAGPVEDLLAAGLDRDVHYRVTAALLAADHQDREQLYRDILLPLRRRALKTGGLTLDDINARFLADADTPAGRWWRQLVLDGEIPRAAPDQDPGLPAVTPALLDDMRRIKLMRFAVNKVGDGEFLGAKYLFDQVAVQPSENFYVFYIDTIYQLGMYDETLAAIDLFIEQCERKGAIPRMKYEIRPSVLIRQERYAEAREVMEEGLAELDPEENRSELRELELLRDMLDRIEAEMKAGESH